MNLGSLGLNRHRMLPALCAAAFGILGGSANASMTTDTSGLKAAIEKVISQPRFRHAVVGIVVLDPDTSEVVYERNSEVSLTPASCMKAITTICALHFLGADHRFETKVEAVGPIKDGVLKGDIVIHGGGDPVLGCSRVEGSLSSETVMADWVKGIRAAGIKEIAGSVVGDASYFPDDPVPATWMWEDIGNYYAAGTSGLAFYENLYYLYFKPGAKVGDAAEIARTEPPTPEIKWANGMKTGAAGSGDNGYIFGVPGEMHRMTRGTIPMGGEFSIKGSLPDSAVTCANQLRAALEKAGIKVNGNPPGAYDDGPVTVVATTLSPPLSKIIYRLCKESNNFFAEMLLMHTGKAVGAADREGALKAEEAYLKSLGVPTGGMHFADGSGLSRRDGVTPIGMARMVAAVRNEPWFGVWLESLPWLGMDGDLAGRHKNTPLKGKVRAKTGLIERVRGLVGTIDAKSGKRYCFAMIANGYDGSWVEVDNQMDTMLEAIWRTF